MKYKTILVISIIFILLFTLGCINENTMPKKNPKEYEKTSNNESNNSINSSLKEENNTLRPPKSYDKDLEKKNINTFTFKFLKRLNEKGKNYFFSPYNIYEVTDLLYEGANGKTKRSFEEFFGYNEKSIEFLKDINKELEENTSKFIVANGIWVDKGIKLKKEYISKAKNIANVEKADFSNNAEYEISRINRWVEKNTNKKIRRLFDSSSINKNTKVVLAGTIYFKGKWEKTYSKEQIKSIKFYNTYKTKFVDAIVDESKYQYYENNIFKALKMNYEGKRISMVVILPKGEEGKYKMKETIDSLNESTFSKMLSDLREKEVLLKLPKFKFESTYDLKERFKEMGLKEPFKLYADFSRMSNYNIKITKGVHKAYIDVNEEGTEAAAATGYVGITSVSEKEVKEFIANHPFLFFIVDNKTGIILFSGMVNNPEYPLEY